MYRCCIHFCLIGVENRLLELMTEMPPLENFTHKFCEASAADKSLISEADVVFADARSVTPEEVSLLASEMKSGAELILLAEKDGLADFYGIMDSFKDIWFLPMSDGELKFRFLRWQQSCKADRDAGEISRFFETTINSVPNLIWYKDKNGIHEKVNDSFCSTVNKTKAQVEGRGHAYIWDVERDDPACIESEREVMSTGKTCVSEETIKTGDGTRLLTTYKSPLYDFDGSVMGTVGVAIDITRERAFEQEIIRKNRSLEKILTSIDCGVLCYSPDRTRIISVNDAALKILGCGSAEEFEMAGLDIVALSTVEEDRDMLIERVKALKNPGDITGMEFRIKHKDGKILHVMGSIKLLEEDGEMFYQCFLLDCTARKIQEIENERRQTELIQALGIDYNLICVYDLDTGEGDVLRSTNCKRQVISSVFDSKDKLLLERDMEEYIGCCVYEEDRKMMREACSCKRLLNELGANKLFIVNYRTMCGDTMKYFQMKAVRTGGWTEKHMAVLGFRSVDAEMRREMEKKSLLEEALMQANKASRAKSVFLSNMSHDIRTPMNAIVGFTSLAISHLDNTEQVEEYLKKIRASGNHLLGLINDVLDMSRIESGKMHIDEKECSLPEIIHGLYSIIQGDAHTKRIELHADAADVSDENIFCDKLRLNQVLLNLLSNAVKYTDPGGTVTMRITEKPGAPKGFAYYEFLIKDTGIGMSEEFVSRIFEPFERERNSTISGIQGTGLGMAITKNIVDMMNGSIEVRSERNVGTECTVSFMFRLASDEESSEPVSKFKGCRALVADGDLNTCDSVSNMLRRMGMRAEWTMSGKEAVLRARQAFEQGDGYSVYIVDRQLPDMDGTEAAEMIRREIGSDTPVIVLTAYDLSDIEEEAKTAGVTAVCGKPLFMSELISCLGSAAGKNSGEEERSETKTVRHSERILLAEDNELNQEIAVAILSEEGFTVDVANNGREAVDMLKNSEPGYYRVVLMDVQMPVMGGYEATRLIRGLENKELASVPILAMTANAFDEDKQEALKSGMNAHIAKPVDVNTLLKVLEEVLA